MSETRAFVHVGLAKTASTLLQVDVLPRLPNLFVVSRPYTQENHAFNKLQYADDSLYDSRELELELERIRHAAAGRHVLLSDEKFSGLSLYNFINRGVIASRLAAALPAAEIILFLRGQASIISSLHNQFVKIGWCVDEIGPAFLSSPGAGFGLEAYQSGVRTWSIANRFINHRAVMSVEHFCYSNLIGLYERLFARVHVFLFEDLRTRPEAVLSRLADVLGAPAAALPAPGSLDGDVNKGISEQRLIEQLLRNRMARFPGPRLAWATRGLAAAIARVRGTAMIERQRDYLQRTVAGSRIAADNRIVEQRYRLGLGRYPDAYPQPAEPG